MEQKSGERVTAGMVIMPFRASKPKVGDWLAIQKNTFGFYGCRGFVLLLFEIRRRLFYSSVSARFGGD